MWADTYILIVCSWFLLLAVFLFILSAETAWYAPASLFAAMWCMVTGFSIFSAPGYYFSPPAILFVCFFVTVFYLGAFFYNRYYGLEQMDARNRRSAGISVDIIRTFLWVATAFGFASVFFLLRDASYPLTDFSTENLVSIAQQFSLERYAGARLSMVTMACLMVCYMGCTASGWLVAVSEKRMDIARAMIVFIPVFIFTFIYTARAILLYAIFLAVSSFLASVATPQASRFKVISKRIIIQAGLGIMVLFGVFVVTQAVRMGFGNLSSDSFIALTNHLKVFFSGNVSAYSLWFDGYDWQETRMGWGASTFAGVSEMLGLTRREVGIYTVAYDVDGRMSFSNIYTLIRFLADDFGIYSIALIMPAVGFISQKLYVDATRGSLTAVAIQSGIYAWLFWSFISSIWAYNTILLAWMGFVLLAFYIEKLHSPA